MIRRPPRSTRVRSSAASDVYKRQVPDQQEQPQQLQAAFFRRAGQAQTKKSAQEGNTQIGRSTRPQGAYAQTGGASRACRDTLCCLPSVSYTHLRAHETVLDLVCRLLLEKKKK